MVLGMVKSRRRQVVPVDVLAGQEMTKIGDFSPYPRMAVDVTGVAVKASVEFCSRRPPDRPLLTLLSNMALTSPCGLIMLESDL